MIKGVTHDNDGRIVQRLSVSTKVAIGLPPTEDTKHPTKLDHFVLLRKKKGLKGIEWEMDPDLMNHYGKDCKEIGIVLIDDDIENIFPTCYAWWTFTERKCSGDGENAVRKTEDAPSGKPWGPCGKGCPDLQEGRCKPSGDLRFVLANFPRLGSVCRIHTSSYRSVRQIHSALQEIQQFTGGRLAGLTAKLVVRPEEMTYFDKKEQKKRTTTIWALSLEVSGDDMKKLISNMTANAKVFIEARKLLGGHVLEVVEEEKDEVQDIPAEFYPGEEPQREIMQPRRMSETVQADVVKEPAKQDGEKPKQPVKTPKQVEEGKKTEAKNSGVAKEVLVFVDLVGQLGKVDSSITPESVMGRYFRSKTGKISKFEELAKWHTEKQLGWVAQNCAKIRKEFSNIFPPAEDDMSQEPPEDNEPTGKLFR